MTRITRGNKITKRRKKLLKFTKSFYGSQSKLFSVSNQRYMKSKLYSYSDRRKKKRVNKKLWINQINCKLRENNKKYNTTISNLKRNRIEINKKQLAKISLIDSEAFRRIISLI